MTILHHLKRVGLQPNIQMSTLNRAIINMVVRTPHPLRLLVIAFFTTFASFSVLAEDGSVSIIQTIAGSEDDNIVGTDFSFGGIAGLALDSIGNTYFTIQPAYKVYRLGVDGRVSVYAGNGIRGSHHDGIPASASPLSSPSSLAVDSAGNLYIADGNSLHTIFLYSGLRPIRVPGATVSRAIISAKTTQ